MRQPAREAAQQLVVVLGPHLLGQVELRDLPRACTPASVRPATVSSTGSDSRITVCNADSSSPWTVRSTRCFAQPEKSLPSYDRSSRTRTNPGSTSSLT